MESKKLFLLDAYALIFRAHFAFIKNPRYNSKRLNTSAIFGFANTLLEVLQKEKPTHMAVAFDLPAPTFRHQLFPEYKAQRPETPEDLKIAVPYIKRLVEGLNIPVLTAEGFEADDIIGTLAKQAEREGFKVFMMTPDKDYAQLVSDNVVMFKPARAGNEVELIGPPQVAERFGVGDPARVVDFLAICGDTSDNIPGIPGVGEKTAKSLLEKYGSIEGLYANLHKLSGKQKEKVSASRHLVEQARVLVTIRTDVPLAFDSEACALKEPDRETLKVLFEELEFNTLARRVLGAEPERQAAPPEFPQGTLFGAPNTPAPEPAPAAQEQVEAQPAATFKTLADRPHHYELVEDPEQVRRLAESLLAQPSFCFDFETDNIEARHAKAVGLALCHQVGTAFYVPMPEDQRQAKERLELFRPAFESQNVEKVAQNIKYDWQILRNYGLDLKGPLFDTLLAHYLVDPDLRHNLTVLCHKYLGYQPIEIEELIGQGKQQISMRQVALDKIRDYACEDADLTFELKALLEKELREQEVDTVFRNLEMPLVEVLLDMESQGIGLDSEALARFEQELEQQIAQAEKQIHALAGQEFNIASPQQLGKILFEQLKVTDKPKMTKTKQYATSEIELQKLADKHPIVSKVLEYRGMQKLQSTYVKALPKMLDPLTGRLHTSFNQAVASTGRLSSNNPNLQNIPIREDNGRRIREAFLPSAPDRWLVSADYSQVELRLVAHLSQDEQMIEAFRSGLDIHTATAAKIYGVAPEAVDRDMRGKAKSANFGIIYGISSFGLAQNLNIPRQEAKALIDGYFQTYPKVGLSMEKAVADARENGFVATLLGRKRRLAEINSANAIARQAAERNAINAPIQGSAADLIKLAMIAIHRRIKEEGLAARMILQVHDELVFDCPEPELDRLRALVKDGMENALELSVPLLVETGIGKNWLQAH